MAVSLSTAATYDSQNSKSDSFISWRLGVSFIPLFVAAPPRYVLA
jgi:hypothetical protein